MRVTTNSVSIYYEVRGKKGAPLILLHGNCEDHTIFDRAVDYLEQVFVVYLVDSRGHGQSSPSVTGEYHYQDMADDLSEFIRKLKIERPIILGYSDGAIVALMFASQHPGVPARVFACGPNTRPETLSRGSLSKARRKDDPRMKMMLTEPNITREDLEAIECPVTVVAGSRDCVDRKDLEFIADSVRDGTLCIMKRADHSSYVVHSTRVVDAVFRDCGIDPDGVQVVYKFAQRAFSGYSATLRPSLNTPRRIAARWRMAPAGETYERELKSLLSGDGKAIARMVKTCDAMETANYETVLRDPFLVIRAAGSLGVDLVALRWDFAFPIEVKSSAEPVLHFSKNQRLTEQADTMLQDCCRSHLVPMYAFRLKSQRGDPWRLFTIPTDHAYRGRHALLYRRMPKLDVSPSGFYIMRWEEGMKLSDFLGYIGMSDYAQQARGGRRQDS